MWRVIGLYIYMLAAPWTKESSIYDFSSVKQMSWSDRMDHEFSVRAKPTEDFLERHQETTMTIHGKAMGYTDL